MLYRPRKAGGLWGEGLAPSLPCYTEQLRALVKSLTSVSCTITETNKCHA